MSCDHDWYATSALRLVVEQPDDWMGNIFPSRPAVVPVEFCRSCGGVRLGPGLLADLNAAIDVPPAADAVDPSGDSNTGTPTPRAQGSS